MEQKVQGGSSAHREKFGKPKATFLSKLCRCFLPSHSCEPELVGPEAVRIGPNGQYAMGPKIADGGFGRVCVGRDTTDNSLVAIKFIPRGPDLISDYVKREILNHRTLRHPNVIPFKKVFLTRKELCIVMEYADCGDMHDYMHRRGLLAEKNARWFFQQLIIAMDYCHKRKVILRDIKLENLLLSEQHRVLKICDFGFSKHACWDSIEKSCVGTTSYLAPEVLMGSFSTSQQAYDGKKVDVWTCGVCLFIMVFGYNPYDDNPNLEDAPDTKVINAVHRMRKGGIKIPRFQCKRGQRIPVSDMCLDLLQKLLERNPRKRIGVEEIMQHPWFTRDLPNGVLDLNLKSDKIEEGAVVEALGLQKAPEIESLVNEALHVEDAED